MHPMIKKDGTDWEVLSFMPEPKRINTPYDDLTYQIIGCAMAVHSRLGPGYREDTYQRDLEVHLHERNIFFESQKLYEVRDTLTGDALIGYYIPDLMVDDKVVVELKAVKGIDNTHLAQVIGYLAVTGCSLGLLINFGERRLVYKRVLPPKKIQEHRVNRQWLFIPDWLRQAEDI